MAKTNKSLVSVPFPELSKMITQSQKNRTAIIIIDGKVVETPVFRDTIGRGASIDVTSFPEELGYVTFHGGPGRRKIADCRSAITYLDGKKGELLYRGYPIEQLAKKTNFLETAYLLIYGELPTRTQLGRFEEKIIDRMPIHQQMYESLLAQGRDKHPMSLISGMVKNLADFQDKADYGTTEGRDEVVLTLLAKMPTIVAAVYRYTKGRPFVYPRKDKKLGYVGNYLRMCFAESDAAPYKVNPLFRQTMERIFILHADHEQNASTSSVRLAGSTGVDPYAAISTGILTLWGPKHGGANLDVIKMLESIDGDEKIAKLIERAKLEGNDKIRIPGLGHAVYKYFDPRAASLCEMAHKLFDGPGEKSKLFKYALKLEAAVLADKTLSEKHIYPNLDFFSGINMMAVGFSKEMLTANFALPRAAGQIAQWNEMAAAGRIEVQRPRQIYVGQKKRNFVPMSARPV